jgi:hypothetical protein
LRPGESPEVFLDTTFILPFFQIDIEVEGFDLAEFAEVLSKLPKVHLSELSIFEAKAVLRRLSREEPAYLQALWAFGTNLAALREDERFVFHTYTPQDDENFNLIHSKNLGLDSFHMIILAQALNVGTLVTEDGEILRLREHAEFKEPRLGKLKILRWKELRSARLS